MTASNVMRGSVHLLAYKGLLVSCYSDFISGSCINDAVELP